MTKTPENSDNRRFFNRVRRRIRGIHRNATELADAINLGSDPITSKYLFTRMYGADNAREEVKDLKDKTDDEVLKELRGGRVDAIEVVYGRYAYEMYEAGVDMGLNRKESDWAVRKWIMDVAHEVTNYPYLSMNSQDLELKDRQN